MVETISGGNEIREFFAQVPIIAQRVLNPFENALYQNYIQTGGTNGKPIRKTTKALASECHMSINKVKSSRLSLEAKGFIKVTNMGHRKPLKVELLSIWDVNTRYARAKTDEERGAIVDEMKPKTIVSSPVETTKAKKSSSPDKTAKTIVSSPVETTKAISSGPVETTNNNKNIITKEKELSSAKAESKPKKKREPDLIFNAIADVSFGITDTTAINGNGGRIGKIKKRLLESYPTIQCADIHKFKNWYTVKFQNTPVPRDPDKFLEHYIAFNQSFQPVSTITPGYERTKDWGT